ncbi:MAG TPA: aminotransferase class IV [Acidimicrobiia bacterium]|nr:aminotransferase class IV [Acidimicrobiia bacterium]
MTSRVLINGVESTGFVPVSDSSVLRGDGCFEVIKAYSGRPFALDAHLDRLERSAKALDIAIPGREELSTWVEDVAAGCPECVVRVVVTRGSAVPGVNHDPLTVVFAHEWIKGEVPTRLLPVQAPWHTAGADWELAGAKVLSYAPNLSASRRAAAEGFDDALLTTVDGVMLEGPTFSVAWVVDGVLETPGLGLGILDSITRRVMLELAAELRVEVVQGSWPLDRLDLAQEVLAISTVREIQPVSAVGPRRFIEGSVTADLARLYYQRVY